MSEKFHILTVDIPWGFSDKLKMSDVPRGAEANYNTMSIDEIKKLPIKDIAADGALLALWVPSSLLQEGLDVMKSWGFNHKQTYIWVKIKKSPLDSFKKWISKNILKNLPSTYDKTSYVNSINNIKDSLSNINLNDILGFNMGRLFRQSHEICLIGINNSKIYKHLNNRSQRSVSFGENLKHSAKPEHLQNSLDLMFPGDLNRIELFARRQRPGWFCFGNESPMTKGEDINKSLNKIINISEEDMLSVNKLVSCYTEDKKEELFKVWKNLS